MARRVMQAQQITERLMSDVALSFEFFPPRSVEATFRLHDAVRALVPLGPKFVSVTYGAGGSTRRLTGEAVAAIAARAEVPVAGHLTCVGASRAETLEVAEGYGAAGVRDIVALRGDAAEGDEGFRPHPDGFADSPSLVAALADRGFRVHVGAYPERHPDAASDTADVEWLKRKVDAGAASAITQFFFEAETFLRFRDRCAAAGIAVPIVPGLLPIQSFAKARRFAERCGASIPADLAEAYRCAARDDDTGERERLLSTAVTAELASDLIAEGVDHLHFYTLNDAALPLRVVRALGLEPARPAVRALADAA